MAKKPPTKSNKINVPELMKAAIKLWGTHPQLHQLQEEAAELIVAVNHFVRNRPFAHFKIAEEIADVEIMIEQTKMIIEKETPDYRDMIESFKAKKIANLKDMIDQRRA